MQTFWIVEQVTEKPGVVLAELAPVYWFKRNPEYVAREDDTDVDDMPDEFIDAVPGEEGADYNEEGLHITIDITNGPELHPMDNVRLTLDTGNVPIEV